MKHNIIFMFIQLIFAIIRLGSSDDSKRFLVSPIGPYELVIKKIYNCNPTKNNKFQHNMYVTHKANSTLILGNSTLEEPFDDTLFLEMKMSVRDSLGNWKENVYSHIAPNACSSLKHLLGNAWAPFVYGAGGKNTNCPIAPGFYTSPGIDISIFKNSNIPNTFFYGTYKMYLFYSRKNEKFGCQLVVMETKRP